MRFAKSLVIVALKSTINTEFVSQVSWHKIHVYGLFLALLIVLIIYAVTSRRLQELSCPFWIILTPRCCIYKFQMKINLNKQQNNFVYNEKLLFQRGIHHKLQLHTQFKEEIWWAKDSLTKGKGRTLGRGCSRARGCTLARECTPQHHPCFHSKVYTRTYWYGIFFVNYK